MSQREADRIVDSGGRGLPVAVWGLQTLYRDARDAGFHDAAEVIGSEIDAAQRAPGYDL